MNRYPATYSDAHGSETTTIDNDGITLNLFVRGVKFVGSDFDSFEPKEAAPEQLPPTLRVRPERTHWQRPKGMWEAAPGTSYDELLPAR